MNKIEYIFKPIEIDGVLCVAHILQSILHNDSNYIVNIGSWTTVQSCKNEEPSTKNWQITLENFTPSGDLYTYAVQSLSPFIGGERRYEYANNVLLETVKTQVWERIKQERERREYGPFTWDGSQFDADSESQRRIQGAAQLAMIAQAANQPFSIDWTLYDNTVRTLDAQQMIAVGLALGTHVATQYAIGRALRAAIEAATTFEELDAIVWPA